MVFLAGTFISRSVTVAPARSSPPKKSFVAGAWQVVHVAFMKAVVTHAGSAGGGPLVEPPAAATPPVVPTDPPVGVVTAPPVGVPGVPPVAVGGAPPPPAIATG